MSLAYLRPEKESRHGVGSDIDLAQASLFLGKAAMAHIEAQYEYGDMIKNGEGVNQDLKLAAKYFQVAAVRWRPWVSNEIICKNA